MEYLNIDHPWATPIRTRSNRKDFRDIEGNRRSKKNTVKKEIRARIGNSPPPSLLKKKQCHTESWSSVFEAADIKTARSTCHLQLVEFARACPHLDRVEWQATDEVLWAWSFKRTGEHLYVTDSTRISLS